VTQRSHAFVALEQGAAAAGRSVEATEADVRMAAAATSIEVRISKLPGKVKKGEYR